MFEEPIGFSPPLSSQLQIMNLFEARNFRDPQVFPEFKRCAWFAKEVFV